ncbi:MAG TPA: hypothetical protein VFZ58_03615 [Candidatus Saccharimonadales bacterium]
MAEQLAQPKSPESKGNKEVVEAAGERLKSLENSVESFDESSQEHAIEHARRQVEAEASFAKDPTSETKSGGEPTATSSAPTKRQKEQEYEKTMSEVRSQLSKPSRAFSKLIHNPTVEKVSDTTASTIARPNAVLAGSITAFLAVLGLYIAAYYFGFRLSGFELIGTFALGWLVGILIDVLRVLFLRRRAL